MPGFCFVNPSDTTQKYFTIHATDPGVPAGYVLQSGSDGSDDRQVQNYRPGACSGGFPAYSPPEGYDQAEGTFGTAQGSIR